MSRLRDAAALLVEQGRALGIVERSHEVLRYVEEVASNSRDLGLHDQAIAFTTLATKLNSDAIAKGERAAAAKARAEELMTDLEHPGARLARRVVATYLGARAAWRGSR